MRGELGSVYIHSKDSLDDRALVRHRATIVKLSGGIKSRIKHLLYNNGVEYPEEYFRSNRHWTRSFITWLQNDVRLLSDTRVSLDLLIAEVLHYRNASLM